MRVFRVRQRRAVGWKILAGRPPSGTSKFSARPPLCVQPSGRRLAPSAGHHPHGEVLDPSEIIASWTTANEAPRVSDVVLAVVMRIERYGLCAMQTHRA
jgi:hypothetical protein